MMHGSGKSDPDVVARKPANKAERSAAEPVERREGTKGNAGQHSTGRAQSRETVSQGLERIRQAARQRKKERFTTLLHHVSVDLLRQAFFEIKKDAAPGVDGLTRQDYEADLERRLEDLHARVHRGAYRALPSRRVYIPKPDGRQRPLAVAALEDKIVQRAVAAVLNAIYEEDFLGFSYGFRPGRGTHDALDALVVGISSRKVNWILDADIRSFLDAASYCPLVHEVRSKSSDCRVINLIRIPFFLPFVTCTTSSSPRFTRCNTVWRETPSLRVASCMVTKSSPAVSRNLATRSSVKRIRQGAPGVSCSPGMMPSLSQRCRVEGATSSAVAAFLIDANSPSVADGPASKHGMFQCRRKLPTRLPSNRWPRAVVLPWVLRIPAITVSG
jgi:hypothetical protein